MYLLIPLIAVSLLIETSFTTFPLLLVCLLCLGILRREAVVFPIAFFASIFFDISRIRPLGTTSLFFTAFLFLVFLYQRKYEINSYPFVWTASFIGSLIFLKISGYHNIFIQAILSSIVALFLFWILRTKFTSSKISL